MICADASLAIKWVIEEVRSENADALYLATLEAGERIVAPPLLLAEITNFFRQRTRRSSDALTLTEATRKLTAFFNLIYEILSPPEMYIQALTIAAAHNLPAAYDAQYLALAQIMGCEFWTDDQKFIRELNGAFPMVRWIGDYPIL